MWLQKSQETGDSVTVFGGEGHASSFTEPWDMRRTAIAEVVAKQKMAKEGDLRSLFRLVLKM